MEDQCDGGGQERAPRMRAGLGGGGSSKRQNGTGPSREVVMPQLRLIRDPWQLRGVTRPHNIILVVITSRGEMGGG